MNAQTRAQKDKEAAANLEPRTNGRCPICYGVVDLIGLEGHVAYHE